MHTRVLKLILIGLAALSIALPAQAVTVDYSLDLLSAYVWRGITFTDGLVFQPSITAAHDSGFAVNVWGNLDIDDYNDLEGDFQEVDITLSYSFDTESDFDFEVGFIEYLFPNGVGDGTREVYLTIGWDVVVSPSLTIYYDFDEVDDFYANGGISFGNDINDSGLSWSLDLTVGYAGEDFAAVAGGVDSGLFDGMASLGLGYETEGGWSLGGFIAYVDNLDDDVLPDQEVDFLAGISFAKSFD